MMFFLRLTFVAISFVILLAIGHDATVGTLDGFGAVIAMGTLLVIALAWRGMDVLETEG